MTSAANSRATRMSIDSSSCPTTTNGSPAVLNAPVASVSSPPPTIGTDAEGIAQSAPAACRFAPPPWRIRPASENAEIASWMRRPIAVHSATQSQVTTSVTTSRVRIRGASL